MAVTKHQFQLLNEMGIELWQRRTAVSAPADHSEQTSEAVPKQALPQITPLNFDDLKNQPLFHDILLSLGLSLGEVTANKDHLDLGLLRWQFSPQPQLELSDKLLTTPALGELADNSQLKRRLWHLLQEHSL